MEAKGETVNGPMLCEKRAVNNAEGDVTAALEAVKELASTSHLPGLTIRIPA